MLKYHNYSENDLLLDDDFVRWMLWPDDQTDALWNERLRRSPSLRITVEKARGTFFEAVKLNRHNEPVENIEALCSELSSRIVSARKRKRSLRAVACAAGCACVVLVLTISGLFRPAGPNNYVTGVQTIAPGADLSFDNVTILAGNTAISIADNSDIISDDIPLNLTARSEQGAISEVRASNYQLIVPKGKRSSLTFADGSVIWLGSSSKVSFPTSFESDSRNISVEGEVYISVARDDSKPFIVDANGITVRVLGTEFGISAHTDSDQKSVVLVRGSVEVGIPGIEPVSILPGQGIFFSQGSTTVRNVEVMDYVSWKDGWLNTHETPLFELAEKLFRYYGKQVECAEQIRDLTCSGKLILTDNIEDVIDLVARNMGVNYTVFQDKISIHY